MTIQQAMKLRAIIEAEDGQCVVEDASRDGCLVRDSRTGLTFRVRSLAEWRERCKATKVATL